MLDIDFMPYNTDDRYFVVSIMNENIRTLSPSNFCSYFSQAHQKYITDKGGNLNGFNEALSTIISPGDRGYERFEFLVYGQKYTRDKGSDNLNIYLKLVKYAHT